jgi:CheY-like chemotaxis protein
MPRRATGADHHQVSFELAGLCGDEVAEPGRELQGARYRQARRQNGRSPFPCSTFSLGRFLAPLVLHECKPQNFVSAQFRTLRWCFGEGPAIVAAMRSCSTPQACIDGILVSRLDAVVLDVQLEGGTGLEVLRAVRSACPQIAFVVFSNNTAAAYRRRYLADGAKCFHGKSADFDQLAQAVQAACARPVH